MPNPIERAVPIYVNDQKVGEATSGSFDIDPGVALHIAQDMTAISRGVVTCKMKMNTLIPVLGLKQNFFLTVLNQQDCDVQLYIGGQFFTYAGIISGAAVKWDVAKGTCDGDWDFIGTAPAPQ
jgi:hypothetical protein